MKYEVAVIGAGPGGYVAAISCAQKGLKTVLIEQDKAGGTCLNRGCIPTKALLHCVNQYTSVKESKRFGVITDNLQFDYATAAAHKNAVVTRLNKGIEQLVRGNGCQYIIGQAKITDVHSLMVGEQKIEFENLIIATGSVPAPTPFPVEQSCRVVDSDGFLELSELPESVLIAGGGVIGIEFATILSGLGKKVMVVEAMPQILSNMDDELARFTRSKLEKQGTLFYTDTFVTGVKKDGTHCTCSLKCGEKGWTVQVDMVISAIGRHANSEGLGLETVGIQTHKGYIVVDDYCRTNLPQIYAIGDVNGRSMLAHSASAQGKVVAQSIATGYLQLCDFEVIPACVYTDPELASVGLTVEQAEKRGYSVRVGRFNAAANGKLMAMGENEGFVKLVSDQKTGELLGAQLCHTNATDIIAQAALAIKMEATTTEIAKTIHAHPTVAEMMMEAAEDSLGECVHAIYPAKG